jgi:hypothetical protein
MSDMEKWFEELGWEGVDLQVPDAEEPATFENILQFISAFAKLTHLDAKGWEDFRVRFLSFANKEVEEWPGPGTPRVKDIGPKLWGFYSGYMACHDFWARQMAEIDSELKRLVGGGHK